jgi:predicted DNA-binding transcriptional regulator YafY
MSRKGQTITLSLQDHHKAHLEALAQSLGYTWGDRPNISSLIKAIAAQNLRLIANDDWSHDRINALNQARLALIDAGQTQLALELTHLLLERSELTQPLRQELTHFSQNPLPPWRLTIEAYIRRNQPFTLSYQDPQERIWQFTIRHAQINHHEERQYLDCWCEETTGSQDLPELIHNRCLRLDRITDAAIAPISGKWRPTLDTIDVEMHLYAGLAFAYRSKTNQDTHNNWHPEIPNVRRIIRPISNTFWFTREILRYGKDCQIIAPESLRDRFKAEIQQMYMNYEPSE